MKGTYARRADVRAHSLVWSGGYIEAVTGIPLSDTEPGRPRFRQALLEFLTDGGHLRLIRMTLLHAGEPLPLPTGDRCASTLLALAPLVLDAVAPPGVGVEEREIPVESGSFVETGDLFCGAPPTVSQLMAAFQRPVRDPGRGGGELGTSVHVRLEAVVAIGEEIELVVMTRSVRPTGYAAGNLDLTQVRLTFRQTAGGYRLVGRQGMLVT